MNAETPVDIPQSVHSHSTVKVIQSLSDDGSRILHKHVVQI
jgi:hypothetical protein